MPKEFYQIVDEHFLNADTLAEGDAVGAALLDVAEMLNDISTIKYLKANDASPRSKNVRKNTPELASNESLRG